MIARFALLAILTLGLTACGSSQPSNLPLVGGLFGGAEKTAATTESPWAPEPTYTPETRAIQVAYTSVRAQKCGFNFNPQKLRASFLQSLAAQATAPDILPKTQRAYDYTVKSITRRIGPTKDYCSEKRVRRIKSDLNRHLAGDFNPPPKKKKKKALVYREKGDQSKIAESIVFGEAFEDSKKSEDE